jgi:hypothetical protein
VAKGLLSKFLVGGLIAAGVGKAIGGITPVTPPSESSELVAVEREVSAIAEADAAPRSPPKSPQKLAQDPSGTPKEMKQAEDLVKLIINLNGHLCAEIQNVQPVGLTSYEVSCTEYRSGSGQARYLVDGKANTASPL